MLRILLTLPLTLAGPDGCSASGPPLTDLDSLYVTDGANTLLAAEQRGREGQQIPLELPDAAHYELWTTRIGGYASCKKILNFPVSVLTNPQQSPSKTWYDVAGRKMHQPLPPGIYWDGKHKFVFVAGR